MSRHLLEDLAHLDVPPPPIELDHRVHRRLNESLLIGQTIELGVRAIPYAMLELARAIVGAAFFTATGRYPVDRDDLTDRDP